MLNTRRLHLAALHLAAAFSLFTSLACLAEGPKYTDPQKADADFAAQGEYSGTVRTDDGDIKVGVQVVAMGQGKFHMVAFLGGLPGDGWTGDEKFAADGVMKDGKVTVSYEHATAIIQNNVLTARDLDGYEMGKLRKVERKSPTLGQQPPAGAVVLFDGKNADAFEGGRMTEDGLLMQGATSKQTFGNHDVHIEFCLPYQPEDRGQGRANSGIYLQGRYEVQMLDSFGLSGEDNECGGLYTIRKPKVNMCFPPLSWQTYDIKFTAGKYDADGKLTSKPRMTVHHNGQLIHDDVELPSDEPTRAAPVQAGPTAGPVYLQDHGCPVRYRNIWVVEK